MNQVDDESRMDDLIDRLRRRAADPDRRTDSRPTKLWSSMATMDLASLAREGRSLAGNLARVLDANQRGQPIDPEIVARSEQIATDMQTPLPAHLLPPATPEAIAAAEAALGFPLPEGVRRIYGGVADGGFGPAGGLLALREAALTYRQLRAESPGPPGQAWPEALVPLIRYDGDGFDAVDATKGAIVSWDPEELTERSGERGWKRTFREIAPSLEAWLEEWVAAPTLDERIDQQVAESQIETARAARAMIGAMSPAERAAMGLPEVGWESIVWGGLGLEEDDTR